MRKINVAEEIIENNRSPQGKRCKTISPSDVSSTGCHPDVVVSFLIPNTLLVNNFTIFKVDSEKNRTNYTSRGKQRKKKQQNILSPISCQCKIHA